MPTKVSPEFRILALPPEAVTKANESSFAFRDEISNLVKRDSGDNNGTGPIVTTDEVGGPNQSTSWALQRAFENIDSTLEFVYFTGDKVAEGASSTVGDMESKPGVGGFIPKARTRPVNCVAVPDIGDPPAGNPNYPTMTFKQKKPLPSSEKVLQTVLRYGRDATHLWARGASAMPDRTIEYESEEPLDADHQFQWDILWEGVAVGQKQKAGARFAWAGNSYSIVFRQDKDNSILPSLDVRVDENWVTIRQYPEARLEKFAGTTTLKVRRMAGRIVVIFISGTTSHTFETILSRKRTNLEGVDVENELVSARWRKGKLNITTFGVSLRAGLSLIDYGDADGKPQQGDFSRFIPRSLKTSGCALDEIGNTAATGQAFIHTGGWKSAKTRIKRKVSLTAGEGGGLRYQIRCISSKDLHDAPFVMTVMGRFLGNEVVGSGAPLDVSSAFLTGSIDASSPESQVSGTVLNLTFSRNLLKTIGEENGVEWKDWLTQYRLLSFETRWLLSDGSYSAWDSLGEYYIEDEDYESGINDWKVSFSCHDPVLRTLSPHSTVDYRFAWDLMQLLLEKSEGGGGAELFGVECVRYLLQTELGADEANRLNGGDLMRFMQPDHYSLISSKKGGVGYVQIGGGDTGPPTFGKSVLPPPRWNCSVNEWIQNLAEKDRAAFFYAPIPGGDSRPSPVFADIDVWQKSSPVWKFTDDNYDPGDLDRIISAIKQMRKGDSNYNTAQALWNGSGGNGNQVPWQAVRVASARVSASDKNAPERSWARTYVQDHVIWWNMEATRAWALMFIAEREGVDIRWPTITLQRGDIRLWWGHRAEIVMKNNGVGGKYSDPDLMPGFSLDGALFRILKVQHRFASDRHGADMLSTVLTVFPVLNNED